MPPSQAVLDLFASEGGTVVSSRTTPGGLTIYKVKGCKGAEIISRSSDQSSDTTKPKIKADSTKPSV
jgi:hypothetical protein